MGPVDDQTSTRLSRAHNQPGGEDPHNSHLEQVVVYTNSALVNVNEPHGRTSESDIQVNGTFWLLYECGDCPTNRDFPEH